MRAHWTTRTLVSLGMLGMVGLTGCASDETADPVPTDEPEPTIERIELSATDHLVRASMALRGIRPSVEELDRVAADPEALPTLVDEYLQSPLFGQTIRDLHDETLLLRTDYFFFPAGFQAKGPLEGIDPYYLNMSVMEAPLRLIEHVVMNDRPYTEIVTADYTLANGVTAAVWGSVDYDPNGEEWQVTRWNDERGNAGILTDSWVFGRYSTTESNANRGRANSVSKALICYDFLSRDIEIDSSINLADPEVVKTAIRDNPACASCHQTLDPLAAFFKDWFPIFVAAEVDYPFPNYNPGVQETYLGIEFREPAYFGQAGEGLPALGQMIAADPRFSLCAAEHFYSYLNQVPMEDVPLERAAEFQEVMIESGMNAKELARAIVLAEDFRLSHVEGEDEEGESESMVGMRKVRPEQLATMFYDLTGFVWEANIGEEFGTVNLARDSFLGYRVIGGGIDAQFVTRPSMTDSATSSLFLRAFAAEAASYVVQKDFEEADPQARRLLRLVNVDTADEASIRAQLAWLHKRVFSEFVTPDAESVSETWSLWSQAHAHSQDPARAWETTLTAMFQDVRIAYF